MDRPAVGDTEAEPDLLADGVTDRPVVGDPEGEGEAAPPPPLRVADRDADADALDEPEKAREDVGVTDSPDVGDIEREAGGDADNEDEAAEDADTEGEAERDAGEALLEPLIGGLEESDAEAEPLAVAEPELDCPPASAASRSSDTARRACMAPGTSE